MDKNRFDRIVRSWASGTSRRAILGGLVGSTLGLAGLAESDARKKRTHGKAAKKRATAEVEPCWRAGACILKKGANVSRCDLEGYAASGTLDCTGCNASRANLRGANLRGANFTRANLSGSCLVDADFRGAIFANSTNLANATFCNTTMPDGSVNNSGCDAETACCPVGPICEPSCRRGATCLECTLREGAGCCARSGACNANGSFTVWGSILCPDDCQNTAAIGTFYSSCAGLTRCETSTSCPAGQDCLYVECCGGGVCA